MNWRIISAGLCLAASVTSAADPSERPSLDEWKEREANASAVEADAAAKQSKMAAVDKVISLLEGLKTQVLKEGDEESQTYNKFACFCKDTTAEKTTAIQEGTDEKQSLSSSIQSLAVERDTLDATIKELIATIAEEEVLVKNAANASAVRVAEYEKNAKDLGDAVSAIEMATQSLKASMAPSMVQMTSIQKTLRTYTIMADALGFGDERVQKAAAAFMQQEPGANPEVQMENYKFHSSSVIETLEDLAKQFRAEKAELDSNEIQAAHDHNMFLQEKTDLIRAKNRELDNSKAEKSKKEEMIASQSARLSTVAATLLDDQQYMNQLSEMCQGKALTWDKRSQVRQDELSALTAAITIVKGAVSEKTTAATIRFAQQGVSVRLAEAMVKTPAAMDAAEADAEAFEDSEAPSFLQRSSGAFLAPVNARQLDDKSREALTLFFRNEGAKLKSALLTSLVAHAAEDPFAKVKVLIQELVDRLLAEASNEATQKEWCDKSLADAEEKRDNSAAKIEEHNANMAELEATRDKLMEEIDTLSKEIADLIAAMEEATKLRNKESAENKATIAGAEEGKTAVQEAITILEDFYKNAAAQGETSLVQQKPGEDAPDAGFANDEDYKGAQGDATGIIGMLEVIEGDFTRTVTETTAAEKQAVADHEAFMAESTKSKEEKEAAKETKQGELDTTNTNLDAEEDSLDSEMTLLTTAIKELLELKPACIDTGMTYEERVARREEELASLKKGLCILENFNSYGPAKAVDMC